MATRVRRDKREHGAVLVTVSLSLVALIAAAALAIDLGSTLVERRVVRNAADHAALAAAWADCHGNDPIPAGEASASRNGYDTGVVIEPNPDGAGWQARVDATVDMRFAGVIGLDTMDVSGEAVADCADTGAGFVRTLFADGNCGDIDTIEIEGSDLQVYGGIHSNGNIHFAGQNNDFDKEAETQPDPAPYEPSPAPVHPSDPITYVTEFLDDHSSGINDYEDPELDSSRDVPFTVDIEAIRSVYDSWGGNAEYPPGDYFFDLTEKGDKITAEDWVGRGPGIYYTGYATTPGDQAVEFIGASGQMYDVTFLATNGSITFGGTNSSFTPFLEDRLLAFTDADWDESGGDACQSFSISMSDSDVSWAGILHAVGGEVVISGQADETLSGAIIAHRINLNGSNTFIQADPSLFPAGAFDTDLVR